MSKSEDNISEINGSVNKDEERKNWVKFDDESPQTSDLNSKSKNESSIEENKSVSLNTGRPAILKTETVHINLDRTENNVEPASQSAVMKNVEYINVRHGFSNGDVIVTLLPINTKWPWITAARFRPELVPEELMAQGLTLTVEEYVHAMELLVNDARFTLYNICYKRVLVGWITIAFLVLLTLLFSGLTGLTLFSLGVLWLVLNAMAIFLCMWIKLKLSKGLEQCLASVNKLLNKHKLLLALDDRGKISCHKVNLCYIYFDSAPCIAHLQQFIESEEGKTIMQGWEQRLDVSANDIVIQGSQSTRLSRKQDMAEQVYVRYLQRWGKDFLRRRLDWTLDEEGNPRRRGTYPTRSAPVNMSRNIAQQRAQRYACLLSTVQQLAQAARSRLTGRYGEGCTFVSAIRGRWGARAIKHRLNLSSSVPGRHSDKYVCPCQFIEEHLKTKPPAGLAKFFTLPTQSIQVY